MSKWFENHRLIGHALGGIGGRAYFNCLEGLSDNYNKGIRVFEADLILTADGYLAARHDWDEYLYDFLGQPKIGTHQVPLDYGSFKSLKIIDKYTAMGLADIFEFMSTYKDMYLVTDTKTFDEHSVSVQFSYMIRLANGIDMTIADRIIPQIYREEMLQWLNDVYPFKSCIYTLYQTYDLDDRILEFIKENKIKVVAMSEERYSAGFVRKLKSIGVAVYVHTINELEKATEYLSSGVRGFYTDFMIPSEFKIAEGEFTRAREGKLKLLTVILIENNDIELLDRIDDMSLKELNEVFKRIIRTTSSPI